MNAMGPGMETEFNDVEQAKANHRLLIQMHESEAPHLEADITSPDQSEVLDALVKMQLDGWQGDFREHLEYSMRAAFKLAVDTEVKAMAELYDKLMSGMQTATRKSFYELDRKFDSSRSWIKVSEK